jgi:hypothetical protein
MERAGSIRHGGDVLLGARGESECGELGRVEGDFDEENVQGGGERHSGRSHDELLERGEGSGFLRDVLRQSARRPGRLRVERGHGLPH